MSKLGKLYISSFNCKGVKSSLEFVSTELCNKYDIIALQELWILPNETELCNTIHPYFESFSTSSVEVESGILSGRPYGGMGLLWRKTLDPFVKPVSFHDNRLVGLIIDINNVKTLIINVYMPTQCSENLNEFNSMLGKILSIREINDCESVCVLGDFNSNVGTNFFHILHDCCIENSLVVADVAALPPMTHTFHSDAHNSTSWLDHICLSENLIEFADEFTVHYGGASSDHFPIGFSLKVPDVACQNINTPSKKYVKWNFQNVSKRIIFFNKLDDLLTGINCNLCCDANCANAMCHAQLDNFYSRFIDAAKEAGQRVFGCCGPGKGYDVVPGWNDYVKAFHQRAREEYVVWRSAGKPRAGPVAMRMRASRAQFKLALRECRASEERLRKEALAHKLAAGDVTGYWKAVKELNPQKRKLSDSIDDAKGAKAIVSLWKDKFKSLFNCFEDRNNHLHLGGGICDSVNVSEVSDAMREMKTGKAVGLDGIPGDVYRYATPRLQVMITIFINSCLCHSYIPLKVMSILIIPLLKNKLKPANESDNYRPIALATAVSKLFEKILMRKSEKHLKVCDNQLGFRSEHSTELCIFALKDIVNYYNAGGSPVFMCFLDIRKAYDRVNHFKLFVKLLERKVPLYIVKILAFWYNRQQIQIGWGDVLSEPFTVTNGIRQGGIFSPLLFNVYLDALSVKLNGSQVGCHVGWIVANHLAYADDVVLLAPSASALRSLLAVCDQFAKSHDILFSTDKTYCMASWPKQSKENCNPDFSLQGDCLETVKDFKYLGFNISNTFLDNTELMKCTRKIYAIGNMVIRRFKECSQRCQVLMFKTYCASIYGSALWSSFNVAAYQRLKVAHNDVLRCLFGRPRYHSASEIFVQHNLPNLDCIVRRSSYSLMERVRRSSNSMLIALRTSWARVVSKVWQRWNKSLTGGTLLF